MCRDIIKKKNYYEILGLAQNVKDDDIKKAYKKLAIKFHPDKNHAPQAADAFKKVSAAYACLSDPEKRKMYDLTGEEPGNNQSAS
jgi:DnaJ family protein B protein 12